MKKLEELGISPAPWRVTKAINADWGKSLIVMSKGGGAIPTLLPENARLIAAAPELYEALRRYVVGTVCCRADRDCVRCPNTLCIVKGATAALRKAGGEDEPAPEQN